MAIKSRNKRDVGFNMASMSDLVFLLLIFFMLTSTLIAPNAIKLLLPESSSKTMAKQTVTVYIDDRMSFYVGETKVSKTQLRSNIEKGLKGDPKGSVVLRADKTVPVQYVVVVIDAVNQINDEYQTNHKVILATKPSK
ncbi:MAG: ExbD/TolR family protein [Bacteroidales bacterium]